jgi:hypothetical protein
MIIPEFIKSILVIFYEDAKSSKYSFHYNYFGLTESIHWASYSLVSLT